MPTRRRVRVARALDLLAACAPRPARRARARGRAPPARAVLGGRGSRRSAAPRRRPRRAPRRPGRGRRGSPCAAAATSTRSRMAVEMLEAALEEALLGEHRERGGAGGGVAARDRDRVEVLADDAARRRGPLDLGDDAPARPGERRREIAPRRVDRAAPPAASRSGRGAPALGELVHLVSEDVVEDHRRFRVARLDEPRERRSAAAPPSTRLRARPPRRASRRRFPPTTSTRRGVHERERPRAAGPAGEHAADDRRRSAAALATRGGSLGATARGRNLRGRRSYVRTAPAAQLRHPGRSARAQLVEPVGAVHDQRPHRAEPRQRGRERLDPLRRRTRRAAAPRRPPGWRAGRAG